VGGTGPRVRTRGCGGIVRKEEIGEGRGTDFCGKGGRDWNLEGNTAAARKKGGEKSTRHGAKERKREDLKRKWWLAKKGRNFC